MRKKLGIGIGAVVVVLISIVVIMGAAQNYRDSHASICTQEIVVSNLNERIKFLEDKYGSDFSLGTTMPMGGGRTSLTYCYPKN